MTSEELQVGLRPAAADMRKQFLEGAVVVGGYSLTSMWRACGRPASQHPGKWQALAIPLIDGVRGYFENLNVDFRSPPIGYQPIAEENMVTWEISADAAVSEDSFQPGDLMGTEIIAHAYAMYLDADGN